jgi:hypothetical protein
LEICAASGRLAEKRSRGVVVVMVTPVVTTSPLPGPRRYTSEGEYLRDTAEQPAPQWIPQQWQKTDYFGHHLTMPTVWPNGVYLHFKPFSPVPGLITETVPLP